MSAKLVMTGVVVAFYRRFLDRAVHPFDLAVGPWMVGLGQSMFDIVCLADQIKPHLAERDAVAVPRLLCELDAIVGENGVDFVRNAFQQVFQEFPGRLAIGLLDKLCHSEFAGSVNGHKEMELTLFGPNLGNVDVEITNRVALELLPFRLVTFHIWKARNAMPLKATVQR